MSLMTLAPVSVPFVDDDIDAETSALIARLALEDLEEVRSGWKGKLRADAPLSDEELAYQLQSQHFEELIAIAEDQKYARSLDIALTTDAAHIHAHITAEEAAAQDRRAAEQLFRGEPLPPPTATQARLEDPAFVLDPEPPILDPRASEKQSQKHIPLVDDDQSTVCGDFDEEEVDQRAAYMSIQRARHHAPHGASGSGAGINPNKTVTCTSCNEYFRSSTTLQVPCNHHYCRECVKTLVDLFTRDESLFPLRCCQQSIPPRDVAPFISSKLRALFEEKHAEFSVLSKDRIYCVQPTCSTFLGSAEGVMGTGVVCPTCLQSTCPRCKQAEHGEEDCADNAAAIELRALARQEGWQTCPGCHMLIELQVGCYHMTCRCRTEFCYVCAVSWKNCGCPQWEENCLVAAAQQRVENEVGARAIRVMAPAVLEQRVAERVRRLRVSHDCDQHNWMYRSGGGMCAECRFNLPSYLLICRNCSLLACVRCSRNRL